MHNFFSKHRGGTMGYHSRH